MLIWSPLTGMQAGHAKRFAPLVANNTQHIRHWVCWRLGTENENWMKTTWQRPEYRVLRENQDQRSSLRAESARLSVWYPGLRAKWVAETLNGSSKFLAGICTPSGSVGLARCLKLLLFQLYFILFYFILFYFIRVKALILVVYPLATSEV